MEAHDSSLRALSLTADGSKLGTASNKGTVIRVWDVASATCLQEFRRGVERASVTCLAWSWDANWLACSSDKGTTHIFHAAPDSEMETNTSASNNNTSYTQMFLAGVRKSVEGDSKKKSAYQVRGLPHPQACAFVADANNVLAVAGWDADGNGVLMLSEFNVQTTTTSSTGQTSNQQQEPRRIGYHVLCRSNISKDESEEARRRRRLRGWTPEIPQTPEGGRLYVGERLEVLERGMEQIVFEETDEFVSVTAIRPEEQQEQHDDEVKPSTNESIDDASLTKSPQELSASREANGDDPPNNTSSPASVKTEPLDDDLSEFHET